MATANSIDLASNSSDRVRVGEQQLTVLAERDATHGSPPSTKPVVQQDEGNSTARSPTIEVGSPKSSPFGSIPQASRVWRSGNPYYPLPHRDGNHWQKVYEKADQFDKEFCGGWNSEIDSLLTFAGLFSAVVTAFTVESYKSLQPDPQDVTNRILLNMTAQLTGRNATELPSFAPTPSSLRINTLWFLSLTFSLTAGLVGILCKQWLRHYQQDISKPPKEALALRQFRYEAFLQCKVMEILGALPVLLGFGLVLFFVGLVDFLWGLNVKVSIPVTILIGTGFVFLLVTTSAPAFQYCAVIRHSSFRNFYITRFWPPLFAFKSPQSLAVLHLVTWLYPPSKSLKLSGWAPLELIFFANSDSFALWTYTRRALTWLDETYSHSVDMVHQICLCLQDVEEHVFVEDMDKNDSWDFAAEDSNAAVIRSLFDTTGPRANQAESHIRRDIIAMRYLHPSASMSFDQTFAVLEHSIRTLNSSHHQIRSLEPTNKMLLWLSLRAHSHWVDSQVQEVIWQRTMLFRNLLLEDRWGDPARMPREARAVFDSLKIFTDEDLDSIFNALGAWVDQNPQHADLLSHCWALLNAQLKPRELEEALHRPPVRDLMAFLDSRFQMNEGVKFMSAKSWRKLHLGDSSQRSLLVDNYDFPTLFNEQQLDSFFKVLYAWIKRNPQDTQSFHDCQTSLLSVDSSKLKDLRRYQSFCDFEAFLDVQIARKGNVVEQGAHDP